MGLDKRISCGHGALKTVIRIREIKIPYNQPELLEGKIRKLLGIGKENFSFEILKMSFDARKKPEIYRVYTVDVAIKNEKSKAKLVDKNPNMSFEERKIFNPLVHDFSAEQSGDCSGKAEVRNTYDTVICGFGPCGIFAAYILALNGARPLVIEQGKPARERAEDVDKFWKTGLLNPDSNVSFGEGGAGTFSDGKLNTSVKDPFGYGRFILETFMKFGADENILTDAKPHIGTDVLLSVIPAIRSEIIRLGGEIRFNTKLTDIDTAAGVLRGITVNGSEKISCKRLVLAIGHSSRDTFELLNSKAFILEPKSFAMGFRIEHKQETIDRAMYGKSRDEFLPPSPYKVASTPKDGRGVYSFCMCPGGYVVNASTIDGEICVNGMSYRMRDGENANSAIVVTVTPEDFGGEGPLAGVKFQRSIEKKAYDLGNGRIPQQLFSDFKENKKSEGYGSINSCLKGQAQLSNLRGIFSEDINSSFIRGMEFFGRKIKDFDAGDVVLSGVEGRTSSPVRILRNEKLEANIKGIYPAGEGAGYAGGIMSAGMDGIKIGLQILEDMK